MNDLKLSRNVALRTPSRYNVLALSGGGYRGLFAASVLAKLEQRYGGRTHITFDLLAGTSIGGIVATALAVGIPARRIADAFIANGSAIFKRKRWPRSWLAGWTSAKYQGLALEKVITDILGQHAKVKLKNLQHPLILPAVNVTTGGPCLLISAGIDKHKAQDLSLREAALATAAAPTYFPSRKIKHDDVVDGGLIANAPDLVALTEATRLVPMDIVKVLSIGTCGEPLAKPPGSTIKAGKIGWVVNHQLIELTLAAQEQLAIQLVKSLLGSRFLRIDARPSKDELEHLGLDIATPVSTELLQSMADRAYQDVMASQSQRLGDFFS